MKKVILGLLAFSIMTFFMACQEGEYKTFNGKGTVDDKDRPIAIVETDTITLEEFNQSLNNNGWHREKNLDTLNFKKDVLREVIVIAAAHQNAPSYELVIDDDVEIRMQDHLDNILRHLLFVNKIKTQINITEDDIKSTYENDKSRFETPEQANVAQILFSNDRTYLTRVHNLEKSVTEVQLDSIARAKLSYVIDELKTGKDFEELARFYSDDTISGFKGGEFGFINKGDAAPSFDSAAFSLPIDSISGPIKTVYGYHIIKVLEKKAAGYVALDSSLTEFLRGELESKLIRELASGYFDSLYNVTKVSFNEEFINGEDSNFTKDDWIVIVNELDTVRVWLYEQWRKRELSKNPRRIIDSRFKREVLYGIANIWLLISEARKLEYHLTDKYNEEKENFLLKEKFGRLLAERNGPRYEPTPEEIEAYYNANTSSFTEDTAISIQQVILEDEPTAIMVKAKVDSGANFYQTALEYFPGDEDEIKKMAINLGWITSKEISQEFFNTLYKYNAGVVSDPIKTEWGWHVVKILGKKGVKSLETVKIEIRKQLIQEFKDSASAEWETRMLADHAIKIDKNLLHEFIFHKEWLPRPDFTKMLKQY
jgi:parvulin-like peptidyl-prolyl isomerase